ncbi:MAG: BON domain-containing protein [Planctomycetaceae bacterium]
MKTRILIAFGVLAVAHGAAENVQAQGLTGRSNASRAGSQMTGGMFGTGSRSGSGSMNQSGAGMNSSVAGGGFLQTTQFGQMATFNNQGFIGANSGDFVGRSATGSSVNGQRNNRMQTGQFQRRNSGGRNGRGGRNRDDDNNDNGSSNSRGNAATRNLVRAQHRVAFDYPQPVTTAVGNSLNSRLKSVVANRPDFNGLDIAYDENLGQATLRGTVKSTEAAQVAVALIRMEPGVRSVKSELSISPETPQPPSPGLR